MSNLTVQAPTVWRLVSPPLFRYLLDPLGDFVDRIVPQWMHPNYFTVLRALLVIPIFFWSDESAITVPCLLASSACDILDGWLARRRGLTSAFGKWFDPVSDKIFIFGTLFSRTVRGRVHLGFKVLITVGELLLIAVRPIEKRFQVEVSSGSWGKAKTWLQTIGLGFVLVDVWCLHKASPIVLSFAVIAAGMSFRHHVQRIFARPSAA